MEYNHPRVPFRLNSIHFLFLIHYETKILLLRCFVCCVALLSMINYDVFIYLYNNVRGNQCCLDIKYMKVKASFVLFLRKNIFLIREIPLHNPPL